MNQKKWNRENELATFLRKRRHETGLSQEELADTTGVGLRFIRDWEQGKPSLMTNKINLVLSFFGYELTVKKIFPNYERERLLFGSGV